MTTASNEVAKALIDGALAALTLEEKVQLLTGRDFDAAEANRLGLVNEVVEPERLIERARELAAQIMLNSPSSVRATKRLINSFLASALDQQIADAIRENASIRATQDFREGVASFLEKRKPTWSGK